MKRIWLIFVLCMTVLTQSAWAGEGAIGVTVDPRDSEVYIDGELKANGTPVVLKVSNGKHQLEIKRKGYRDVSFEIFVDNGATLSKQVKLASLTEAQFQTVEDKSTAIGFVRVPAGCFKMGKEGVATPVHEVCVDAFDIGKYEVTQGQWKAVMGNNPSSYSSCGDSCPVEKVSWTDVQEFIGKLNGQGGVCRYSLPTEAEWEYACRSGGKDEEYCGGGNIDRVAWYSGNSGNKTHPVGQMVANGLGLYDMSGNVWEWVMDRYDEKYYAVSPRNNPSGPDGGSIRVKRGGGWNYDPANVRSANRDFNGPGARYDDLGFRLARICP